MNININTSPEHISKQKLIDYIKVDLFVDEMIIIDRHVETCLKCKKQLDRLKSKHKKPNDITFLSTYKYAIGTIILAVLAFYIYKNQLLGTSKKEGNQSKNSVSSTFSDSSQLSIDSLVIDTTQVIKDSIPTTVNQKKPAVPSREVKLKDIQKEQVKKHGIPDTKKESAPANEQKQNNEKASPKEPNSNTSETLIVPPINSTGTIP